VTHNAACTISPVYVCDSGNIADGGRCYKKGDCGKENGRPCLIVERIPSCNKGLAEDFLVHKCIKQTTAACLTMVRTINVLDTLGRGTADAKKFMDKALGTLFTQMPAMKLIANKMNKAASKLPGSAKSKSGQDALLDSIASQIKPLEYVVPELKRVATTIDKTAKTLRKVFTSESFCTRGFKSLNDEFAKLKLKPNITLKKKAGLMDGLLISPAHAATGEHFFMSYTFSASGAVGIGLSLELTFVTDYRGSGGVYFGLGPQIVTNATIGGAFGLGFYPKVDIDSFAGWGWGVGVSAGPPSKIVSGGADFFSDEKLKTLQGFGFNVGVGLGVSPVDVTFGATHSWKL
jgi:hypothetical protein